MAEGTTTTGLAALPLDDGQRAALAALGVVEPAQLQGLLADADSRALVAAHLGLADDRLAAMEAALARLGHPPSALPPLPLPPAGVVLPEEDAP